MADRRRQVRHVIRRGTTAEVAAAVGYAGELFLDQDTGDVWICVLDGTAKVLIGGGTTGWQPIDSDLTAIAALSTQAFGRALLELIDAAALRTAQPQELLAAAQLALLHVGAGREGTSAAREDRDLRRVQLL